MRFFTARSQNKNGFLLESSIISLVPKAKNFNLQHEATFPHDYSYNFKFSPKYGVGIKLNIGYEFAILNKTKWALHLPLLLGYKLYQLKFHEKGEYYGGISGRYFYGDRNISTSQHVGNLSFGLNYSFVFKDKSKWFLEVLFSGNLNFLSTRHKIESPENCLSCQTVDERFSFSDKTIYPSLDFKIYRQFDFPKYSLAPYIGYNLNYYYDPHYKITRILNTFDNAVYDLKYYHFIEAGLKLKL